MGQGSEAILARQWRGRVPTILLVLTWVQSSFHCRLSEFRCQNVPQCIRLDQVCDGNAQCSDQSDEPPGCTVCNKTYYGDSGKRYHLTVDLSVPSIGHHWPFECSMKFVAGHHELGELVKLTLDTFRIGRFQSAHHEGCPEGFLQISDGKRFNGGQYCGSSDGDGRHLKPIYISETNALTAFLQLYPHPSVAVEAQSESKNALSLTYEFLSSTKVESARPGPPFHTGILKSHKGLSCAYELAECHTRRCRIQSPNYPGMYPRNLTCSYHVRVRKGDIPSGTQPLISLFPSRSTTMGRLTDDRRAEDCDVLQNDHLMIHDGTSPNDPVLAQLCLKGTFPRVTAHGSNLMVVFRSSPFAEPKIQSLVMGAFQLDVQIEFANATFTHVPSPNEAARGCAIKVRSGLQPRGRLTNVPRTLADNSTCEYRFLGAPNERVWLTFIRFDSPTPVFPLRPCTNRLILKEIGGRSMGTFCDSNPPRQCEHSHEDNSTQAHPPRRVCRITDESYLSRSPAVLLRQEMRLGSVKSPMAFDINFEFVPLANTKLSKSSNPAHLLDCHQWFVEKDFGRDTFHDLISPRNVFLYGRGGASTLNCTFNFQGGPSSQLTFELMELYQNHAKNSSCRETASCLQLGNNSSQGSLAYMTLGNVFLDGIYSPSHCRCGTLNSSSPRLAISSRSSTFRVEYHIKNMAPWEDFTHFGFRARFAFTKANRSCPAGRVVQGSGGMAQLAVNDDACGDGMIPPLIFNFTQIPGSRLFIQSPGILLPLEDQAWLLLDGRANLTQNPSPDCPTADRILIESRQDQFLMCPNPSGHKYVELIGPGALVVRASSRLSTAYVFRWLLLLSEPWTSERNWTNSLRQASKDPLAKDASPALLGESSLSMCTFACPELLGAGCIDAKLWCDGLAHCPSGFDESEENCRHVFTPILYTYFLCALALLVVLCTTLLIGQRCRQRNSLSECHGSQGPDTSPSPGFRGHSRTNPLEGMKQPPSLSDLSQDFRICAQGIS